MADLFDRFTGGAGLITGHTADSGDTWGVSGTTISLSGTGTVYQTGPYAAVDLVAISSWTPPGTDYAASVVYGAGFRQTNSGPGIALRLTMSSLGNWDGYIVQILGGTPDQLKIQHLTGVSNSFTFGAQIGTTQNLAAQLVAGDTITAKITGTSPVVITVYKNGTQIYQATDSSGSLIAGAGQAGLVIASGDMSDTNTDVIRTMWAGAAASGPPAITIAPTSVMFAPLSTQSFTLSTPLTNETFAWTASAGTISGALATEVWTAPGSGSSMTVTGTSIHLPTRRATAAVTLTPVSGGNTGGSNRRRVILRKPMLKRLDFPLPDRGGN